MFFVYGFEGVGVVSVVLIVGRVKYGEKFEESSSNSVSTSSLAEGSDVGLLGVVVDIWGVSGPGEGVTLLISSN